MSSLVSYLFHRLNIKTKTVGPYNHQSLQEEHRIKSLETSYEHRNKIGTVNSTFDKGYYHHKQICSLKEIYRNIIAVVLIVQPCR